jgi:hypothetical protein
MTRPNNHNKIDDSFELRLLLKENIWGEGHWNSMHLKASTESEIFVMQNFHFKPNQLFES